MIDEMACEWTARIDRGLTESERTLLAKWCDADPRHRGALLRSQAAWSLLDRGRALHDASVGAEPPASSATRRHFLQIAAGGVAAIGIGALSWRLWPGGRRIGTGVGEIRHLPLEDGSLAVINSASKLRVAFTSTRRDVELAGGEAWFQVAKNRARPFTVVAGSARVQAVGTAFDVRRLDGASDVIVTEGTVRIWSTARDERPLLVSAGHAARIDDRAGVTVSTILPSRSQQRLAWREGRLELDDMTLAAAAAEFNRYNTTQLAIDPALADHEMVGWFQTDDVEGFAKASAMMVGARIERQGDLITIKKMNGG